MKTRTNRKGGRGTTPSKESRQAPDPDATTIMQVLEIPPVSMCNQQQLEVKTTYFERFHHLLGPDIRPLAEEIIEEASSRLRELRRPQTISLEAAQADAEADAAKAQAFAAQELQLLGKIKERTKRSETNLDDLEAELLSNGGIPNGGKRRTQRVKCRRRRKKNKTKSLKKYLRKYHQKE
jgi:hypothetical protein